MGSEMLPNSDLFAKRNYQINNIKIFNDNVIELEDNKRYQVRFTCGENQLSLEVILGPAFPYEKPVVKIFPSIAHEWICEGEVVGAPGLNNFNEYSELGRVIQVIISHFKKVNPPLSEFAGNETTVHVNSGDYGETIKQEIDKLNLSKMSVEELKLMITDANYFESYFIQIPAFREANEILDKEIKITEELAKKNLAMKEPLNELVENVHSQTNTMRELDKKLKSLQSSYEELCIPFEPSKIMSSLEDKAASLDLETEKIIKNFLNGGMDPDAFLKTFIELRSKGLSQRTRQELLKKSLSK